MSESAPAGRGICAACNREVPLRRYETVTGFLGRRVLVSHDATGRITDAQGCVGSLSRNWTETEAEPMTNPSSRTTSPGGSPVSSKLAGRGLPKTKWELQDAFWTHDARERQKGHAHEAYFRAKAAGPTFDIFGYEVAPPQPYMVRECLDALYGELPAFCANCGTEVWHEADFSVVDARGKTECGAAPYAWTPNKPSHPLAPNWTVAGFHTAQDAPDSPTMDPEKRRRVMARAERGTRRSVYA